MRRTTLVLALITAPAALAAQRHGGVLVLPDPPAHAPPARVQTPPRYYDHDRYPAARWPVTPRISIDSAVSMIQAKYQGWFVDSKELSREYRRPIYIFRMIGAGQTGTRQLWVDGNTGDALNPEVLGVSDSVPYYQRWSPPYPLAPTYP